MEYRKYTQIFNRYMPVIKILLKKSLQDSQSLNMDKGDFEKVGTRKSGFKFRIEFVKGRVNNIISGSEIATELAIAMQENEGVRNILITNDFSVELNTRYQLKINCLNPVVKEPEVAKAEEEIAAPVAEETAEPSAESEEPTVSDETN